MSRSARRKICSRSNRHARSWMRTTSGAPSIQLLTASSRYLMNIRHNLPTFPLFWRSSSLPARRTLGRQRIRREYSGGRDAPRIGGGIADWSRICRCARGGD